MLDTHSQAVTDLIDEGSHSSGRLSRALALLASDLLSDLATARARANTAELALLNLTKQIERQANEAGPSFAPYVGAW